jgi:hypothetical protein
MDDCGGKPVEATRIHRVTKYTFSLPILLRGLPLFAHPATSRLRSMAKLGTRIHEAITHQLRLLYDGIISEGVPDRLAAILSTAESDPAAIAAVT